MKIGYVYKEFGVSNGILERVVGKSVEGNRVVSIDYHSPAGEGDAHYCDVHHENGYVERVFRPDKIDWKEGSK